MIKLKTIDSVREQLALGNKLHTLKRRFIIDLQTRKKEEVVEAEVARVVIANLDEEPPYIEEAEAWLDKYLPEYTTIVVKGKYGRVARVPFKERNVLLPKIIEIFNS